MKIGNKIKAVLKQYPDIRKRRAELNAVAYLANHGDKMSVEWHREYVFDDGTLPVTIWTHSNDGRRKEYRHMYLKPLSEYKIEENSL